MAVIRLATPADYDAIEKIAHDTLLVARPGFVPESSGRVGGFKELLAQPGTIICCAADVSAFAICRRIDNLNWQVAWVMPHTMPAQTGKDLMAFAMAAEHAVRKFTSTTRCFSVLSKESNIERATADAYKIMLSLKAADSVDDGKTITNALLAPKLATLLGVSLA